MLSFRNSFLSIVFSCCCSLAFSQTYPAYTVTAYDTASKGYYFCTPTIYGFNSSLNHLILDDQGRVVYTKTFPGTNAIDFKIQPNGLISYSSATKVYLMDSTFTVIDSVSCGNGVNTDTHDMQILPNGHFLMLGFEYVIMDLSSYNMFNHNGSPGSSTANVRCAVIQELDVNHNVIFEWHSKDYFSFGDVSPFYLNSPVNVDWTHSNAVELDTDGNILLSSRHFNEITKISRTDSSVIWRMGGNANQFTFPNDPQMFRGQHDIRRIANGNVTMNDNGRGAAHPCAAKEYTLDENLLTATLVWSYTEAPVNPSLALGSVQRLSNGNTVVDNGNTPQSEHAFNAVTPAGNKIFEITFDDTLRTYRAFNYLTLPWALNRPQISCYTVGPQLYLDAGSGYSSYLWSNGATTQTIPVTASDTFSVFVPYGQGGFISSDYLFIPNPATYCTPMSVNEISENHFSISPNPAADELVIEFSSVENKNGTIEILDCFGKVMSSYVLNNIQQKITFNISDLASGIYFVKMDGVGKKFVKL